MINTSKALAASPNRHVNAKGDIRSLRVIPHPGWLPESEWPFETLGLEVDGSTIAVTDVGQGPVLLFVHTGMWSFIWRDVMTRLATDFRCICLDSPGTGQSDSVPGSAITLENASRAVRAVIERLGLENLTLVVHDLGGLSGLAGAAYLPGRIRGIAAINAFGWRPAGSLFRGMLALVGSAPMRELDAITGMIPRITARPFGVGRRLSAAGRKAFLEGVRNDRRRAFHYYMNDARHCDTLFDRVARALAGPFKDLPLLTIFGEHNDPLGFQPQWMRLFPGALQVVVENGNHFPMCDDPDLVARTLRSWHQERVAPSFADINEPTQ